MVTVGVDVGVPLRTGVCVASSMTVMMVGGHRGGVALAAGPLLYLQVPLSCWHVNRRSGGLRASSWGFVLGAFFGKRLKLCEGDGGRRGRWVLSLGSRSSRLRSGVKQRSLGLLFPILKRLSPSSVGFKCSLG